MNSAISTQAPGICRCGWSLPKIFVAPSAVSACTIEKPHTSFFESVSPFESTFLVFPRGAPPSTIDDLWSPIHFIHDSIPFFCCSGVEFFIIFSKSAPLAIYRTRNFFIGASSLLTIEIEIIAREPRLLRAFLRPDNDAQVSEDTPDQAAGGSGHDLASNARMASKARATASTPRSSNRRPTICSPIGRPSESYPQLTDAAGCSDMLNPTVKPTCGNGLRGSLLGEAHSAGKAVMGAVGDSI